METILQFNEESTLDKIILNLSVTDKLKMNYTKYFMTYFKDIFILTKEIESLIM
jgi:hypothetical protein